MSLGYDVNYKDFTKEQAAGWMLDKCKDCGIRNDCSGSDAEACLRIQEELVSKFSGSGKKSTKPLADAMRPTNIDEVFGQRHLIGQGKPLTAYLESGCSTSAIFYGPPGTGKTTVASLIAETSGKPLVRLNATTAGTADIREVLKQADASENGVLLYLDEIQFFNKKQQQTLLSYVESGKVQLIGSTTENPYFYIYKALLSRSVIFEFKSLDDEEMVNAVVFVLGKIASMKDEFYGNFQIQADIPERIARMAAGDVRKALTVLELLFQSVDPDPSGTRIVTLKTLDALGQTGAMRYDHGGDEMYDLASGLHKSLRGSDPDASLHYLARFLEAGDMMTPIRRLLCAASEDVGLAWSECAAIVKSLCDTALQLGLPEAQLPLAHAAVLICNAPKSGSVHEAIGLAWSDVKRGAVYPLPRSLQNVHADTTGTAPSCAKKAQNYLYPHDYPNHWVDQPYLPEPLKDVRYYRFGDNPAEQNARAYWQAVKGREI